MENLRLLDTVINVKTLSTLSITVDGRALARIYSDGKVTIAEGYTPDEVAKAFWDAIERFNPLKEKVNDLEMEIERLNKLLIQVQTGG